MIKFFFFKQKTAYDMRISDWSSDVCSSDLNTSVATPAYQWNSRESFYKNCQLWDELKFSDGRALKLSGEEGGESWVANHDEGTGHGMCFRLSGDLWVLSPESVREACKQDGRVGSARVRSEEHTSELQSLMRNSYAVFCLKKK